MINFVEDIWEVKKGDFVRDDSVGAEAYMMSSSPPIIERRNLWWAIGNYYSVV